MRRSYSDAFRHTFRLVQDEVPKIINSRLPAEAPRRLLVSYTSRTYPTEYPFIFRYAYQVVGRRFDQVKRIAAAIHLLQTSTFVLDDVIDGAARRFGKQTLVQRIGPHQAVAAGVLLQGAATDEFASQLSRRRFRNEDRALRILIGIPSMIYSGQYRDMADSGSTSGNLSRYFRMVDLTTSSFLRAVATAGALIADAPAPTVALLSRFAELYGRALQVSDDLGDLLDLPRDTGKDFGLDLDRGRPRLPLVLALRSPAKTQILGMLERLERSRNARLRDEIISTLQTTGSIARAREIGRELATEATAAAKMITAPATSNMLTQLSAELLEVLDGYECEISR